MKLKSKILIKVRLVSWILYVIFEILLQVLFRFFVYWEVNNILYGVNLIQSVIDLHLIPTPYRFRIKFTIVTYDKKHYFSQVSNQKMEYMIQLRI